MCHLELHVNHQLVYRYGIPVALGPQRLQLFPRLGHAQKLIHHQLSINPKPVKQYSNLDAEGNMAHWLFFEGLSSTLEVRQIIRVESLEFNPFDYIIYPFEAVRLPFDYPDHLRLPLSPYLGVHPPKHPVTEWASHIRSEADDKTVDFLILLCERLSNDFMYEVREVGPPHPPEETLIARRGSCRDLSYLMMEACRFAGLAARFVSGYAWMTEEQSHHDLHAWVEVYLPGAGWRGFDPTLGAAVNASHIALAASVHPHLTTPLSGTYYGGNISDLKSRVTVEKLEF